MGNKCRIFSIWKTDFEKNDTLWRWPLRLVESDCSESIEYVDPEVRKTSYEYITALISRSGYDWHLIELAMSFLDEEGRDAWRTELQLYIQDQPGDAGAEELPKETDELISLLKKKSESRGAFRFFHETFAEHWQALGGRLQGPSGFVGVRRLLLDSYHLNQIEIDSIVFIYIAANCGHFRNFIKEFDFKAFLALMARILHCNESQLRSALRADGRLIGIGLIERDYMPPPHFITSRVIDDIFVGMADSANMRGPVHPVQGETFPLDSFSVSPEDSNLMRNLLALGGARHYLLYGASGTGKSAFARSLAQATEKAVMELSFLPDQGTSLNKPFELLRAQRMLKEDQILIVDDADGLLHSESLGAIIEKDWLAALLDSFQVPVIWVASTTDGIHQTVKRRMTYSREFRTQNIQQRHSLWGRIVSNSRLANEMVSADMARLSRRFPADAGGIAFAVESAAELYEDGRIGREEIRATIDRILSNYTKMTIGHAVPETKACDTGPYDPALINTDVDLSNLPKVLSQYLSRDDGDRQGGLNLLFWGEPGTGKTAYVRHLAESLDVQLRIERTSDLLISYVGQTEKRIAEVFAELGAGTSILLLDEADSMLADRKNAEYVWERTQTNELLTQMESHKGVFVCCTNAKDVLDPAVLRRFTWKVQFGSLEKEGLYSLFLQYFGYTKEEASPWKPRLLGMPGVTPGDFGILWKRYQFEGLHHPEPLRVLNDLESEISYRAKSAVLGFRAG